MTDRRPGRSLTGDAGYRPTREDRADARYGGPPGQPGPPPRLTRRGKIVMWVAAVVSIAVLLVSLGAYAIYAKLDGNLSVTNAFGGLKSRPAAAAPGVQNLIILG